MSLISFYTLSTSGFLMFSGGIERDKWHLMGCQTINMDSSPLSTNLNQVSLVSEFKVLITELHSLKLLLLQIGSGNYEGTMTIPTIHAKVEMEEDTFKNIYQVASFVLEQEKRKKNILKIGQKKSNYSTGKSTIISDKMVNTLLFCWNLFFFLIYLQHP